jgi:hypothetical protein
MRSLDLEYLRLSYSEWKNGRNLFGGHQFVGKKRRPIYLQERHQNWCPDLRSDTAIVLQGPLVRGSDFTVNSIKSYRVLFPKTPIILSTWDSEDTRLLAESEKCGAHVVTQKIPKSKGIKNSNLQMLSSSAGIQVAKAAGSNYILKTRTDQRIHSDSALSLFHSILKSFPLEGEHRAQHSRILTFSLNTFLYRLYGMSDMMTFGYVGDIEKYWNGETDTRSIGDIDAGRTLKDWALQRMCEVGFCSSFLENTGWSLKWTLEDSWKAFGERFAVIDACSIDLLWRRYTTKEDRWQLYSGNPVSQEIDFARWLQLKSGELKPDEAILDTVIG